VNDETESKVIQLVEPNGHRRAHIVFSHGRYIPFDLELGDLVERVREFVAHESRDLLTLPAIDTVYDIDDDGRPIKGTGVVVSNPFHMTRRAAEQIQSMSNSWLKAVPGSTRNVASSRAADAAVRDLRESAVLVQRGRHG
jgi:hypothetical protein